MQCWQWVDTKIGHILRSVTQKWYKKLAEKRQFIGMSSTRQNKTKRIPRDIQNLVLFLSVFEEK